MTNDGIKVQERIEYQARPNHIDFGSNSIPGDDLALNLGGGFTSRGLASDGDPGTHVASNSRGNNFFTDEERKLIMVEDSSNDIAMAKQNKLNKSTINYHRSLAPYATLQR